MNRRVLHLLAFGLLAAPAARAQVYEPGYIVRVSGDTLRGEVENAFWDAPPTYVRFRAGAGAPSQLLQPRQLRAFGLTGGRYYQYQTLPIDHAAQTKLASLPTFNATDVQRDSVLAEVLVEGPVMLWQVPHEGVLHLLLRRPGQPVLELTERRYLRQDAQGRSEVVDGNNYRAQLTQYFGDCPAVLAALPGTGYSARELVALLRTYYQSCAPGQGVARSWLARSVPRRGLAMQGGLLAGVRYNRIGEGADCTDCAVRPFGGLYLEVLQPSRTMAIYGELSASSFANAMRYTNTYSSTYSDYSYRGLLLTARLGLRYLAPLPHEQYLVAGLGLELNFIGPVTTSQTSGPPTPLDRSDVQYASPALLPNFTLGWRYQRLTLLADAQLYRPHDPDGLAETAFGNAVAVRAGASFRLGPHPDWPRPARPTP